MNRKKSNSELSLVLLNVEKMKYQHEDLPDISVFESSFYNTQKCMVTPCPKPISRILHGR